MHGTSDLHLQRSRSQMTVHLRSAPCAHPASSPSRAHCLPPHARADTARSALFRRQGFYIIAAVCFAWQWLPEFLFPFVASLAPLCWFASRNHKVNFLGAGRGGVGLLNITLNWSNITSTVITLPYHVQVTVFAAFALTCVLPSSFYSIRVPR